MSALRTHPGATPEKVAERKANLSRSKGVWPGRKDVSAAGPPGYAECSFERVRQFTVFLSPVSFLMSKKILSRSSEWTLTSPTMKMWAQQRLCWLG